MKNVRKTLGIFLLAPLFLVACSAGNQPSAPQANSPTPSTKIKAVGSFYPNSHFIKQIGGDFVNVTNITPVGSEPHDYEPTPRQIADIYSSKLLILNGAGMDPWATDIESDLRKKGVKVLKLSEGLQLLPPPSQEEAKENPQDPHFWLNPVDAQKVVAMIRDALIQIDPIHQETYQENAEQYLVELKDLDITYKKGLANCKQKNAVTSHATFGYLARQYGFKQIPISGLSPDEEPSLQRMSEIAAQAKKDNIKYIFFETLISPKLSETIAQEIGAKTLVFNPIEGLTEEEVKAGKTFISIMKDNIKNLRLALECQ